MAEKSQTSPYLAKKFNGLNNVVAPNKYGFDGLTEAVNVFIDNEGGVVTRDGSKLFLAGNFHSLHAHDFDTWLYRKANTLCSYSVSSGVEIVLRSDMMANNRCWFATMMSRTFYTDGAVTGIYDRGVHHGWGVAPPTSCSGVSSIGNLDEGMYHFTYTYVRNDGFESGVCRPVSNIVISDKKGVIILFAKSIDADVVSIRVYLSHANGKQLFLAATLPNSGGAFHYKGTTRELGMPCYTLDYINPPAGQLCEYYRGRMYVASNDVIWYSDPFTYEHFDLTKNFMQFDSPIMVMQPVTDGIYVATKDVTYSLIGNSPPFQVQPVFNYGGIYGTQKCSTTSGNVAYWASRNGVCKGMSQGQVVNLTAPKYSFPTSSNGLADVVNHHGLEQYILTILSADTAPFNLYNYETHGNGVLPFNNNNWEGGTTTLPMFLITGGN